MNTPQKKKEKKLFLNFFRDNSIIEWNKVEKLWQDRDGPIHARTIATSRPWGCLFNIQSDALRRSRPDLFQNNCANAGPSIDATCEFLRNSPLLEVPRPNPIRGEGRKKERKKKVKKPRRFFSTFQWTSVEKNAALGTERKRVMSCAWNRSELLVHRKWIPTKEVERNDWSHLHATRTTRQLVVWMDPWNYRYFGNQEYNVFKKIR